MQSSLNRLMLYVRDLQAASVFYERHFGFAPIQYPDDRVIELFPSQGGASLMLHQAAKSVKTGQVTVKIVFDVEDVDEFKRTCSTNGLQFGPTHQADGYCFANTKDPDGNSIAISNRAFRDRTPE